MSRKTTTWEERRARYRVLERERLTAEEKARWEPMLHETWHAIGFDAEQAMREAGERAVPCGSLVAATDCTWSARGS